MMQVTPVKKQSQINLYRLQPIGLVFWHYYALLVFRTYILPHSFLIFTSKIILWNTPTLDNISDDID